jgi:TRAP-type C4-dicarboxylate transport system substrate-binding protein
MGKSMFSKLSFALVAVLLCFFFFCAPVAHGAAPVIKLRYASWFAPTHKNSILVEQWCREVEKRTNGRVKITLFAGGTLSPAPQVYDSLVKGAFDIGTSLFTYSTGRFTLSEVLDLPLGYTSGYQATNLANAYWKKFKPKEFDDVQIMYLHAHGPCYLHTKKPIARLEEVKGLRIKTTGLSEKIVAAIGGTPVTIPITETYDALQKGIADGMYHNLEVLKTFRFGELLKCTILDNGISNTTTSFVAMNKQKWNSLPEDIKKIIEQINEEWMVKQAKLYFELDKMGEDYLLKSGSKIVKVSKAEQTKSAEKMKGILDAYVEKAKVKGLPGDQALNFCLDYIKTNP